MTYRPTFTTADLERAAKAAKKQGVRINLKIVGQEKVWEITPDGATVPPASPLDEWRAKRAGNHEGHS